ncbi:MAG: NADPH:quinone reductase [Frankia sp.]
MKAVVYERTGGPEVLRIVERPDPEPGPGEVRVRLARSGVNPTDWKSRTGSRPGDPAPFGRQVPNQDGAGTIDAVGAGVDPARIGERVWIWEAAWRRAEGTAQEAVALPERQAVALPPGASFDLGASLGIPALTAHRALTIGTEGPLVLAPGSMAGQVVLVAGGAGLVGHAAIELARWAGAIVVTTVSSGEKATLARAAGAHHVVNYRTSDAATEIRKIAPAGVNLVVEVNPIANLALDLAVLGTGGSIAIYADTGGDTLSVPIRPAMTANTRFQFVLVYTVSEREKRQAVMDVSAALAAGALRIGPAAGLPVHHFAFEETAAAHGALEKGMTGKVLIDITA